jgi:hypothetical protein
MPGGEEERLLRALANLVAEQNRSPFGRGGPLVEGVESKNRGGGNTASLTTSNGAPNGTGVVPFEIKGIPADEYCVQFGITGLPVPTQPNPAPLLLYQISTVAQIIYSVGGHQTYRKVSVGRGTRVCGQADAITIAVRDNTNILPGGEAAPGYTYQVNISVARGTRPAQSQPPVLAPYSLATGLIITPDNYLLLPGTSFAILIPPDAGGIISLNVTAAAAPAAPIAEGGALVQQLAQAFVLRQYDPRVEPWVPLEPGTDTVKILNTTGAQTIQFSVLFGVDG